PARARSSSAPLCGLSSLPRGRAGDWDGEGARGMKAVILAAGYATRLYPLTLDRPKPLLEVGGRSILERLIERLAPIETLDGLYVVTNSKFAPHFLDWAAAHRPTRPELAPTVIDDNTTDEEN